MHQIETIEVIDQMNRKIKVPVLPKRIISLVPSQTELLYDLGLDDEVVGQTLFCIHPDNMHQTKPRIGGTKKFNFDKIDALKPDLIIGNKEENDKAQIELLMEKYPVWMSDIVTFDDALDMINKVGKLAGKKAQANLISSTISTSFDGFKMDSNPTEAPKSVLYLIWRKPFMAAGFGTFINEMINRIGLKNALPNTDVRYPELTNEKIAAINPDYIFLSSEPYPFAQKHMGELQAICPRSKIILVDGEVFSWYGSRLKHSVPYFKNLLDELA